MCEFRATTSSSSFLVMPAEVGIHGESCAAAGMDSCFRGNDEVEGIGTTAFAVEA
jgi:hypothetical protein